MGAEGENVLSTVAVGVVQMNKYVFNMSHGIKYFNKYMSSANVYH